MKPNALHRCRESASSSGGTSALVLTVAVAFGLGGAINGCIEDPTTQVETVATGLNNPAGILVRTDGTLLVAESGAARVVTVDAAGDLSTFIGGFPLGSFFPYDIGPLALFMLDDGTLLVGEGGQSTGRDRIQFYSDTGEQLADRTLTPVRGGNIAGLAVHPVTGDLYAASAGSNVIHRSTPTGDGGFTDPDEFVSDTTAPPIGLEAPTGLAFEPDGALLVALSGFGGSGIVRLSTDPAAESVLLDRAYETTGVVTAIAIRPSDGGVFFTESTLVSNQLGVGRVARLNAGRNGDTAVDIVVDGLAAPSALAFGSDGTLYVAILGATPNDETGALLAIRGLVPDAAPDTTTNTPPATVPDTATGATPNTDPNAAPGSPPGAKSHPKATHP